jgi:hypothetical protein
MHGHAMRRLAVGTALALLGVAASTVHAQEYAIYVYGHAEPVKASFYAEEPPWIFFRDDESQYVFTVGCNRVRRVERGGREIPPMPCLVERVPTTMSQVYGNIMELEDKRLQDLTAQLRDQTRDMQTLIASSAAAGASTPGTPSSREMELLGRQALEHMREKRRDLLREMDRARGRVDALVDMSKAYPKPERQRFYFFSK